MDSGESGVLVKTIQACDDKDLKQKERGELRGCDRRASSPSGNIWLLSRHKTPSIINACRQGEDRLLICVGRGMEIRGKRKMNRFREGDEKVERGRPSWTKIEIACLRTRS